MLGAVLWTGLIVVGPMVVARFAEMFREFGVAVSAVTRWILGLAEFFSGSSGPSFVAIAMMSIVVFLVWIPVVLAFLRPTRRLGGMLGIITLMSGVGVLLLALLGVGPPMLEVMRTLNAPAGA